MLFNSYSFLFLFLPVVLTVWWTLPRQAWRLAFLAAASWVFYGWWDYRFVPLMILSSTADYLAGQAIAKTENVRARKTYLVVLIIFNLGILAVFKYFDFFAGTWNGLARSLGLEATLPVLGLILPVGISFYTFNSISYTIDVYRNRISPARSLLEFTTFVAMFPHLIAGPIVRYSDMDDQFRDLPKRPKSGEIVVGLWFFVLGMTKKVLIADVIASRFVGPILDVDTPVGVVSAWLGALAYSFQIYFDFSAYSDMAVGLAFMLGLRFPQNFNSPYKSENISEFWRRWHMSLSFWLRDYLFIPLGGSRGSQAKTARNLAVTMLLGGLWHGASWTFVLWGAYHGLLLALHAVCKQAGITLGSRAVSIALTFVAVMIGWVLFRAPSLDAAGAHLAGMLGMHGGESLSSLIALVSRADSLVFAFAAVVVWAFPNTSEINYPRGRWAALLLAGALLLCSLRFSAPSPFLYFQF